jgi:hypothetical protein
MRLCAQSSTVCESQTSCAAQQAQSVAESFIS